MDFAQKIANELRTKGLNAVATAAPGETEWSIAVLDVIDGHCVGIYDVSDYEGDSAGEQGAAMRIAWTHFQKPTGAK